MRHDSICSPIGKQWEFGLVSMGKITIGIFFKAYPVCAFLQAKYLLVTLLLPYFLSSLDTN